MGGFGKVSLDDITVKVTRGSAPPCGPELVGFIACLDTNANNQASCAKIRVALEKCMAAAGPRPKKQHKLPINFHLQQLVKSFRRR